MTSVKINFKKILPLIWLRSYWTDFSPHQFDSALANEHKGSHKNNGMSGTLYDINEHHLSSHYCNPLW